MPNSYTFFKSEVREYFKYHVSTNKRILDVGPGEGTYSKLIRDLGYKMDCIEIWEPYTIEFELAKKYDNVFVGNVLDFDISNYDYIIMGDVLEHISTEQATQFIDLVISTGKDCLVAIPYEMEQGEYYGNVHETHLQPDLTHAVMKTRYPQLTELYSNNFYGYYISTDVKFEKAYVLYANEAYTPTLTACVESLNAVSSIPVIVYLLNSDRQIPGATMTINWECDISSIDKQEKYIDRADTNVYRLLIERPKIVKDALLKYAKIVTYVDSDSVATKNVDKIFDMYNPKFDYPYFTEGIYDYLHINGRGGADTREDMSTTLEAPACGLFNVNQYVRQRYRQTGYFIASHYGFDFLEEWYQMCKHPAVMNNHTWFAAYHEETIVNVLLWKWNKLDGLPFVYANASLEDIDTIYNDVSFGTHYGSWKRLPDRRDNLFFLHGEKDPNVMRRMIQKLQSVESNLNVLYLAPHLSTGGMPEFLNKLITAVKNDVRVFVVEYSDFSPVYVVQKNKIKDVVPSSRFFTLGENKMELMNIIKNNSIDVVHVQEMVEGFEDFNRISLELLDALYANDRTWKMIETCHNVWFNPDENKKYQPEAYALCTPYHLKTFKNMDAYKRVIEFPIENNTSDTGHVAALYDLNFDISKRNCVNVGLWTPGKNQKEGLEIARKYPNIDFHFVGNQAPNFREYWEPLMQDLPANVKIWGERNDVDKFLKAADIFMFNSTWECNPLVLREAIGYGLPIIARNLPQYEDMFTQYLQPMDTDLNTITTIYKTPDQLQHFIEEYVDLYQTVNTFKIKEQHRKSVVNITQNFVERPFLEITGDSPSTFVVHFYDESGSLAANFNIKINSWVKLDREWYTKWTAKVWENDVLIYENTLNYEGKRVFISIDSASLGDNIAWIPYCEEFRKKHNCHVIVSTYKNFLFEKAYPELEFVIPGTTVNNIYGQYIIGWRYDKDKEPVLCNTIPLQKAATNILGLEFKEIRPRFAYEPVQFDSKDKFVTIATNSTSGCKFWTKEGWQEVINYLVSRGYKVFNVSKEKNPFNNCTQIEDTSMDNTINMISNSEFFIGLSSGLSWLAWAIGKQVVMISNFTEKDHEFQSGCIRITDETLCHGCWNNPNFKFDKGDYDWCPINKNTPKHFECHRGISSEKVITSLQPLIVL